MPLTTNYSFPTPSSGDDPDVPSDMLALAQDIDTKLKNTISTEVTNTGTLTGTYSGQQLRIITKVTTSNTDSNADTIVLNSGEFTGILFAAGSGTSTFGITASFRMLSSNLVARLWSQGTLVISSSVAMTYLVVGW